jgi:hypothetical protein
VFITILAFLHFWQIAPCSNRPPRTRADSLFDPRSITRLQRSLVMSIKCNAIEPFVWEHMKHSVLREREETQAIAQARLRRSGYHELRNVSCIFYEGVLTLRGRVSTWYLKQVAQTLVLHLDGVLELNNRLEVIDEPSCG